MTSLDIELAVSNYIGVRANLIIPNVSWGFLRYEADLVVVTKANKLWEIEIKVTKSDLIQDQKKRHCHDDPHFSRVYFAMPESLKEWHKLVPNHAGIILVDENGCCSIARKPKSGSKYIVTPDDRYKLARLGALRMWGLKRKISSLLNLRRGIVDV